MEHRPNFEAFDPFGGPKPQKQPIHLNLNELDAEDDLRPDAIHMSTPAPTPNPHYYQKQKQEPKPRPAPVYQDDDLDDEVDILMGTEDYEAARKLAEMKFDLFKMAVVLLLANAALGCIAYFNVPPGGSLWFVWPLGFSALFIAWRVVKVYLLNGLDLRSLKERRLEAMTRREIARRKMMLRR